MCVLSRNGVLVSMRVLSRNDLLASMCGVVYSVKCSNCDQEYIGETARMLGTRFQEHTDGKHPNSAIAEHTSSTGNHYTLDDTKILVGLKGGFRVRSKRPFTYTNDPMHSTETEARKSPPSFFNSCHMTLWSCDKPLPS